eukprot:CAMPEP_0185195626 /NCGR_PEP_ID=MMETSP1140-20130426/35219_1 /TAXON_ID=298111 /ORGANISM="Pavlova sp., Strain CCMP459" /LENGTH=196 /DNA_ID=CAMNT_0027762607 /DNA_START=16 /DNA_END=606 /DNA_ORIENTATION=-
MPRWSLVSPVACAHASPRAAMVMRGGRTPRGGPGNGGRRSQRVGQVVRTELANVINFGVIHKERNALPADIRRMISIVDVSVSDDLRAATVRVSVLGERLDNIRALRWLQDNHKSVRFELAQKLPHMKRIPALRFTDVDISSPVRVMALIDQLAAERGEGSGANDDDDDLVFEFEDDEEDLDFDAADEVATKGRSA